MTCLGNFKQVKRHLEGGSYPAFSMHLWNLIDHVKLSLHIPTCKHVPIKLWRVRPICKNRQRKDRIHLGLIATVSPFPGHHAGHTKPEPAEYVGFDEKQGNCEYNKKCYQMLVMYAIFLTRIVLSINFSNTTNDPVNVVQNKGPFPENTLHDTHDRSPPRTDAGRRCKEVRTDLEICACCSKMWISSRHTNIRWKWPKDSSLQLYTDFIAVNPKEKVPLSGPRINLLRQYASLLFHQFCNIFPKTPAVKWLFYPDWISTTKLGLFPIFI
jgi:hypothetical protein